MTATRNHNDRAGLDGLGLVGMIVVGVAAAVLSFSTWVQLAEAVGFSQHWGPLRIAWLLPLAVDCYTLTVIRVWLASPHGSSVVAYAKANAVAAIGLSVAGQAAYHAFTAAGWRLAQLWWFAIIIGGIPPLLLGLVMDLYTRLRHERENADAEPVAAPVVAQPPATTRAPAPPVTPPPARPPATRKPTPTKPAAERNQPATVTPIAGRSEEELLPLVAPLVAESLRNHNKPPSQQAVYKAIKRATGSGAAFPRIEALIARAGRELQLQPEAQEPATGGDGPGESPPLDRDADLVGASA